MPEESQPKPKIVPSTLPKHPSHIGNFRSSATQFLIALIAMLFVAPLVDELKYGSVIDVGLLTFVLILGVLAVGRTHRTLLLALFLAVPAITTRWIHHFHPQIIPAEIHNLAALIFICFIEYQLLHFIFTARRVNGEVLSAGISGYLLLGIVWMSAYMLVSRLNPVDPTHPGAFSFNISGASAHSLSQFEAYYFSFITLSTVGYGDISPITNGARTLAMTEAMTGTLYMAVLISRLVALYSSQSPESPEPKN